MFVREQYSTQTLTRVFTELCRQDFIVLKHQSNPGRLNIEKELSYTPILATGDVIFSHKTKQSKAGMVMEGDATIYVTKKQFDACNITVLDKINIGGTIQNNTVQGGSSYKIKEIKYDAFLGSKPFIGLILEKLPWD
ncbi:MAG: hypothetical protein Kow00102_05740 [Spirochaetota bacterium]|nr:hypothetical protein [Spirochaetota bacterium]